MPLTDEQYRAGAIAHINTLCKQPFKDGELPADVEIAVDLVVKSMKETNVASQSLGDMAKSFFEGATYRSALNFLKPHMIKKVGFK